MAARKLLPLAVICALLLAVWLVRPAADAAPLNDTADPDPRAEHGDDGSPLPRSAALSPLEEAGWQVPHALERDELPTGTGRLRVAILSGFPQQLHRAPFRLRAEPEDGGGPVVLRPRIFYGGFELECAELPARRYRLSVVRGPGDRADADISRFWVVDPPTDRVAVASGTTTEHNAFVVERVGAPKRGSATIRGWATLDGRPAEDLVVRVDPLSGSRVANVGPDGSFVLENVPAGLVRVELCSRIHPLSSEGPSTLVYVSRETAPPADGVASLALHATTAVLTGTVRLAGRPAPGAVLELSGEPVSRALIGGGDASLAQLEAEAADDGRFWIEGLPAGTYRLRAAAEGGAAAPIDLQIAHGARALAVDVTLDPCVPVAGTVEVAALPELRGRRPRVRVSFRGPVVSDATVVDGCFAVDGLIPGRYEVVFRGLGRRYGVAEPVDVGTDGVRDLHLVPIRR